MIFKWRTVIVIYSNKPMKFNILSSNRKKFSKRNLNKEKKKKQYMSVFLNIKCFVNGNLIYLF